MEQCLDIEIAGRPFRWRRLSVHTATLHDMNRVDITPVARIDLKVSDGEYRTEAALVGTSIQDYQPDFGGIYPNPDSAKQAVEEAIGRIYVFIKTEEEFGKESAETLRRTFNIQKRLLDEIFGI